MERLQNKRLTVQKILVLAENLYEDLELWYPVLRLREEGAAVTVAGSQAGTFKGKHGYPVTADIGIAEADTQEFDGVIVPGGYAPDYLRRNEEILRFVREMSEQNKLVAAICHAGWVLISAGILKGRKATCYFAIRDDVVNAGANYEDAEVVRDGNLITSRQPSDLGAFCREIIRFLTSKE